MHTKKTKEKKLYKAYKYSIYELKEKVKGCQTARSTHVVGIVQYQDHGSSLLLGSNGITKCR